MLKLGLKLTAVSALSLAAYFSYSPLSLFAAGEQGAWYDPSDLTTMFQDSAGTTPVTAVEQKVGLILDKSQGLALGAELVTNGDFSNGTTGWTAGVGTAISISSNRLRVEGGPAYQGIPTVANRWYLLTFDFTFNNQGGIYIGSGATGGSSFDIYSSGAISTSGQKQVRFRATGSTTYINVWAWNSGTEFCFYDNISVREIAGNHASQTTDTAKPILSARVNLLTYSEQFDNAAWSTGNVNIAAPTKVSADEVSFPAVTASGDFSVIRQVFTSVATDYVGSVELKAKAAGDIGKKIGIWINDGAIVNSTFHTLTADWVRIAVTEPGNANATSYFTIGVSGSGFGGGGNQTACSVNIRRADLRPANAGVGLPAYQRVGAAVSATTNPAVTGVPDYDTTGFPLYLKFDGTDDFLQSATISPGSVNKAQVFAGVRKVSDANNGFLAEYSPDLNVNSGSFYIGAPVTLSSIKRNYAMVTNIGSTVTRAIVDSGFGAPVTNVLSSLADVAGSTDKIVVRLNGTQQATITSTIGSGNFGNYPLYVGARYGAPPTTPSSLFLNGQLYSLIVRFSATNLDAATITSTETWVNTKTLAY